MKSVMVFGTFDILHLGHIALFEQAKKYGDMLIVVVGRDVTVKKVKGKSPLYTEQERVRLLRNIRIVDKVVLGSKTDRYAAIKQYKPDVVALGYDQVAFVDALAQVIDDKKLKTTIVRLKPRTHTRFKSSHIKKHLAEQV